jgi:hypothetical protein
MEPNWAHSEKKLNISYMAPNWAFSEKNPCLVFGSFVIIFLEIKMKVFFLENDVNDKNILTQYLGRFEEV